MKHEDENEFFDRLEADLAADSGGEVVDLGKARTARTESADTPTHRPDSGGTESPDSNADG